MLVHEDEKLCITAFESYLMRLPGIRQFVIEKKDEAPDYWMSINRNRYGVEITQIVEFVEGGKKTIELLCYKKSIYDLAKSIETNARILGLLHGKYYLHLKGTPRYSPKKDKKGIVARAILYIEKTQNQEMTNRFELFQDGRQRIEIMKTTNDKSYVKLGFHVFSARWQTDSIQEALRLFKIAFAKKEKKLSKAKELCEGIILLILNRYQPFFNDDWQMFFDQWESEPVEFFHSVYFITSEGHVVPAKVSEF